MNNYVKYTITVYIISVNHSRSHEIGRFKIRQREVIYEHIVYYLWDSIVKGLTDDVHHDLVKNYKTDILQQIKMRFIEDEKK